MLKLAAASPRVVEATAAPQETRNDSTTGRIGQTGALALSRLPHASQQAAVETIQSLDIGIPAGAVEDAVEEVLSLPPSRQEVGIKRALKRKADTQRLVEIERKRKRENRGQPKAKKQIPDVRALPATWAAQIGVLSREIAQLKPHRETINKDANFTHLDKKVTQLADLMNELRMEKRKPEPMRTIAPDFKQLN